MKSTPGPWKIDNRFNSEEHAEKLCSIVGGEMDWVIAEVCGDVIDAETSKANACLIAAAPIMYEYIAKKAKRGYPEAIAIIAAIRKAKGEL